MDAESLMAAVLWWWWAGGAPQASSGGIYVAVVAKGQRLGAATRAWFGTEQWTWALISWTWPAGGTQQQQSSGLWLVWGWPEGMTDTTSWNERVDTDAGWRRNQPGRVDLFFLYFSIDKTWSVHTNMFLRTAVRLLLEISQITMSNDLEWRRIKDLFYKYRLACLWKCFLYLCG